MVSKTKALALALGVALAGAGGLAVAQQAPAPGAATEGDQGSHGAQRGRWQRPSPELRQRMIDGRLAGAKAALRLSPDQEKLWSPVEQVIRENAAERARWREEMHKLRAERGERGNLVEGLERISQRTAARATELKRLADAMKPLYGTLSDEQKQVLRYAVAERMHQRGEGRRYRG